MYGRRGLGDCFCDANNDACGDGSDCTPVPWYCGWPAWLLGPLGPGASLVGACPISGPGSVPTVPSGVLNPTPTSQPPSGNSLSSTIIELAVVGVVGFLLIDLLGVMKN
jgi:hypothetical protein